MSISTSLNNALSGLSAASRGAEVVSANVANALTEGYGRREVLLSSRSVGGNGAGVNVDGVARNVDMQIVGESRLANASVGHDTVTTNFLTRIENAIGLPDDPGSLTSRIAQLEANLIEASSRPDSEIRLRAVFTAAQDLAVHINNSSDQVQSIRMETDQQIAKEVATLNDGLKKVEILNNDIQVSLASGRDATSLMDQRQRLVDQISSIVPLREVPRENGKIALFTTGGGILLEGRAAEISFTSVGVIVPEMTIESGALSTIGINGIDVLSAGRNPLAGGSLSGLLSVRDTLATGVQSQLDAVARDLVERFADPAADATLGPSDAGLFTDEGSAFLPANEIGLSSRLSINSAVDPATGTLWKLRDGLMAATPGPIGDNAGLLSLADALSAKRVPASGSFAGAARSAVGLASDFLSLVNTDLLSAQSSQTFSIAKFDTLKAMELQNGVDTDHEMQNLLLVEQAYSANARVISAVDQMIKTLMGI